ncbi:MAG: GTPase Era [Clostridiales Family XIII bacterium]|nr:GTPase Era [Clostridiales Family XIII bacterium]
MRKGGAELKSGFVAIIGRPNVGKSTLLNAIVGEKVAITADKPQTTRNRIRGIYNDEDCQIVFIDTPGVTTPRNKLGEYMAGAALNSLPDADAVLFLIDSTSAGGSAGAAGFAGGGAGRETEAKGEAGFAGGGGAGHEPEAEGAASFAGGGGDRFILDKLRGVEVPKLLVINKIDLISPDDFKRLYDAYEGEGIFADIIGTAATDGLNVKDVVAALKKHMGEGPRFFPADMITDHPERFLASEIIREKLLHYLRDEVPHGVAVEIESYKEGVGSGANGKGKGKGTKPQKEVTHISAIIYTEKKSHKGIIIGKDGRKLKGIGKAAREDIERLLGEKVFLELWVKVKDNWRDSDYMLGSLGYKE